MPHLEVNGASLYYERTGSGRPAFAFVHGGLCTHRNWSNQVEALGGRHQVLTMDLRGHGRSTGTLDEHPIEQWAADLNTLIDMLAIGPVILTGHSLAARIVAEAAWARPDTVAALILLDGSRGHGGFAATAPAAPPADAPPPTLAQILEFTVGPYADPAARAAIIADMAAAPSALLDATVEAMRAWDLGRADLVFRGLNPDLPVLAIQSTYHDRFTPRRSLGTEDETTPYLEFLKSVRPGLSVKVLPATGHFSMIERSDEVTSVIRDFGIAACAPESGDGRTIGPTKES